MLKKLAAYIVSSRLEIIVFFGGAIGMIMEIVGSRAISPYFGNSLIVWTSLIGVVLGCLSLGYYYGGKLADKTPTYDRLGQILLVGSFIMGISAFFKEPILSFMQFSFGGDLRAASFTSVFILFGPASVILGMIAPFAARLKLSNLKSAGKTVGNLYALSTFGSITGTFLAGFYLIPKFGNSSLLYGLAFGVLILSFISVAGSKIHHLLLTGLLIFAFMLNRSLGLFKLNALEDIDSMYNRILVKETVDSDSNYLLGVSIDNAGVQSVINPDRPDDLYLDYVKAYRVSDEINNNIKKALMVGGGGFSFPRYFINKYPSAQMDVVEIDPEMTEVARKYFFLKDDERLKIVHQDARLFLNESNEIYDVIFLDAFTSITPPSHLTTIEFMKKLSDHLSDDGFLMINLISSFKSEKSRFLNAERNTLMEVFPLVDIYQLKKQSEKNLQNLMAIAYKKNNNKNLSLGAPILFLDNKEAVLTDDWSPVEYMTRQYY